MHNSARRGRGDDGAAAVEFALLFPVFMVLALGMISGGVAFSKQLNVTQSAREASRYGATYDITVAGGLQPWLRAVRDAAVAASGNSEDPMGGYDYVCVAYVATITQAGSVQVDPYESAHLVTQRNPLSPGQFVDAPGPNACPSVTPALIANTRYVQVAVARDSNFLVPGVPGDPRFIDTTLTLDSVSVTPYELRPANPTTSSPSPSP